MNPQLIFWLTFAVLGIIVILLSRKSNLLKDNSTATPAPYSWSRVQLAWWTVIVLSAFIAILFTYDEAPELLTSTVILLGISAATTAVGQAIDAAPAPVPPPPPPLPTPPATGKNLFIDILSDGTSISMHRFQTLVFNLVFGCWFIVMVLQHMHNMPDDGINAIMPDIPNNNLILLGLSSATYAAVKTTEK